MKRKIVLKYKNKRFDLELKQVGAFGKFLGLMFCRRRKARALLFSFKKSVDFTIHSWFVFFDFLAIWLNENDKIIEVRRVAPYKINIKPKVKFMKLIEIPISNKYKEIVKLLDEN